ncbi:hypothetical protein B0H14DRAFT_3500088 [Mycena olivaceomarginata]|nr:hypothetical protein B0H14DRAFT_3500088 [Mycena olivaceomarginata]
MRGLDPANSWCLCDGRPLIPWLVQTQTPHTYEPAIFDNPTIPLCAVRHPHRHRSIAKLLDAVLATHDGERYRKVRLFSGRKNAGVRFVDMGGGRRGDTKTWSGRLPTELRVPGRPKARQGTKDVVTLSASALLSLELVDTLFLSGYSRFPVHYRKDPGACVGLLWLKSQTGRAHLLLISRTPRKPGSGIGIITLEDVLSPSLEVLLF